MPKKSNKSSWNNRGGGRAGNSDEKHYFGHDDRVGRVNGTSYMANRPRVSFKTHTRPKREIPRNLVLASLDEDIPMTGTSNNNTRQVVIRERGRGMCRGRNSPLPNRNFRGGQSNSRPRTFPLGDSSWYRISIPYGQKYEKDYILRSLMSYMEPEVFVPILYKVTGNEANFYIDDQKIANLLVNCDRKITTTDGFKLNIRVKPGFPQCEIDDKLKERLKVAMAKRYIQETNALDLSKFHQDPDLVNDYFCALFRPTMLMTVLDIVAEHIPTLEALNLEGNKLHIIERLNVLSKKFPKLKILYIGDNKIRELHQIDVIKDLKLEELRLAGNPVCNKYKSRQSDYMKLFKVRLFWTPSLNPQSYSMLKYYKSEINTNFINIDVRKRFPKLMRLDGTELPRPIVFDVIDEVAKAPPVQRMFATDAKSQEIASQFLQQYFLIFDSENRQPLLDAYNEHACFSMTISYSHSNKLNGYLMENRNLFRVTDTTRRHKLLKQGRLPVVSFISEMPQTKHLLNTFTMDVILVTQAMMIVTVTGYFQELNNKEELTRYFNRSFVIIPEGNGYCIRNEQLHIAQPSDAQIKQLNNQLIQAEQPTLLPSQVSSPTEQVAKLEPDDIKQQMIISLSQQTNMNGDWSLKCLQEVQWNYNNAIAAFQDAFKRGQIPSEAFTK